MPELPEVETVRRGLAPVMEGRVILRAEQRRADLRFPLPDRFVERLSGARIERLARQAKFLAAYLSTGEVLVMHLGMTGRFTISGQMPGEFHYAPAGLAAHDHVIFHMEGGETVTYNDPRRFGFMELWPTAEFMAYPRLTAMGPEPLSNRFSPAYLDEALAGKAAPIKAALLDQKVIAGLGNIYVCEALFRAGISPKRLSKSIPGQRAARLAPAINSVIAEAIEAGGSSISDFAATDGALGYFQHRFDVYDREGAPCKRCGTEIRRIVQSGRSTFYCPSCQR
ncbi:bifunctional DNA-formamidopyrimidine glycosylase/DNA-(apurinic or apyrimidinic site) lyase [Hyphomonas sediminis]|uniref:bifunctional DNA-formamidopyrimidine glycosylase/DNA-(apurinic or apyrimidinic site) lyase n=1 Tax=Hyphomonas sediminis TaxID=2866160 RepID=UPI001CEC128D|nr:bifunctional DNA-formamidopyrimidine glycosylase/DNA-(apurinic or apyrimidinic site) lyase [Hyphomonas sediminis]